jgi:hypothetical protein
MAPAMALNASGIGKSFGREQQANQEWSGLRNQENSQGQN